MFRRATATVLMCATAFTSPAWAGMTVDPVKPQVSINRGEGFKPVTAPTGVSTGDRVMAGPGGHGKIVYGDGCVVDVYPGNVVTVPGKCYMPMTAGLEAPPPPVYHIPWWLVGTAAVGIGLGICAAQGCFNNEEPPHGHVPESP